MTARSGLTYEKDDGIPPRERLLAAAADLFYRHGIRAVGVEAIAEAARTNKMTLYRHFASKDELVAEYLRQSAKDADACWSQFEKMHPGDPLAQLREWLNEMAAHVANVDERGCPIANAAVELPEKDHPARRVIEEAKAAQRSRLVSLCGAAGLSEPELLAAELQLLLEGARVTAQSVGALAWAPASSAWARR
jgi:AcrR family transcriptional regulator